MKVEEQLERDPLHFAIALAVEAGALALKLQPDIETSMKADLTVVTGADLAVQALIRRRVHAAFPTHAFLGEEEVPPSDGSPEPHAPVAPQHPSAGLWIVDPIDGTDSYARHMPVWSVCLGLALDGNPALGVVYIPATGELFYARAGGEAIFRGSHHEKVIQVANQLPFTRESMLLITSTTHRYADLHFPGKVRAYGSTAAHLCYVAAGGVDAAVVAGTSAWDVFAAGVILESAGGGLFEVDGAHFNLRRMMERHAKTPLVVACAPGQVQAVLETFRLKPGRRTFRSEQPG